MNAPAPIELLAPAGGPRALRAALAAGADAVYFGLERWSARAFAGNFAGAAIVEAVETAHLYDARAYLALNTLLKDGEVGPALAALQAPYLAGLDALIVADLGFALRVREEYPGLPLHASTQAGTHSSSQLAALARLGLSRAVLARELSLDEIAALDVHGLELEAFVHGALCYGYSGDCLLSSMVGGRSGNRGRCSQSCRLRYTLSRTGGPGAGSAPGEGDEATRVMSTSDLAAIEVLPRLVAAGVTSLKIEGRMKDAAYVGVTTSVYREALDAALADAAGYVVRPEWRAALEQSFSRSFTTAHLEGRHQDVRSGGRGGHRGVLVGRVARVDEAHGTVEVRLAQPVSEGDVVYLYTPWGQSEPTRVEQGGDEMLTLRVRERVAVKDRLFRLAAADVGKLGQDLTAGRLTLRPVPLRMRLEGTEGASATLTTTLGEPVPGVAAVTMTSERPLAAARTAALTADKAHDALAALGGTPYSLSGLDFAVADGLFLGVGDLKELRRRAVAELDRLRLERHRRAQPELPRPRAAGRSETLAAARPAPVSASHVVLVVRPGERPLPAPGVGGVCLDVLVSDDPQAVVAAARDLGGHGLPLRLRMPEVLFDADEASWRALLALPWQGVYARHLGVLAALADPHGPAALLEYPLHGLNGLSPLVARTLDGRPPAAVLVSPESSLEEVTGLPAALADALGGESRPPRLEILAFGRQQVLRTRDQLGRAEGVVPAPHGSEHVGLVLEDAKGYRFPADVDAGGTRLFNARVTNLAANVDELRQAGVGTFLVVQADLDAGEREAFRGGGLQALAAFAARERSTTGHLFRGVA
jgi:putative protease